MQEIQNWFADIDTEILMQYIIEYGTAIISALLIFIIGKWVARRLANMMRAVMQRNKLDPTIIGFITNIAYYTLLTMVIIAAIGTLGVETTSLAAVIAAAGLAIGLALQGSLSNFAAGVMIVFFRPFKSGDFIEAAGTSGTVKDVSIFTTHLLTPDNRSVIVPNNSIIGWVITNFSAQPKRRIDMVVGVGYDDDLSKVKKVLTSILDKHDKILKDPAYTIAVSELADSSVNLVVRPWVASGDYWPVRFELTETIKTRFDKEGISIPYPQRDLHIIDSAPVAVSSKPKAPSKSSKTKKAA